MRRSSQLLLLTLPILVWSACSGNKEPEPLPSQTTTSVTPSLEPPPPLPPPVREVRPTSGTTTKVIDPGDPDEIPRTLLEASRYAKDKKSGQREAVIVITDDNLHEFAEGIELMRMEGEPAFPAPKGAEASGTLAEARTDGPDFPSPDREDALLEGSKTGDRDESYWRGRALELRMGWRRAQDQIEDLELEAAALRQEFYAQDDNYVRDSRIKPAWDRVLDRIHLLEDKAERYERELEVFVVEGQRAGVPQGWLNVGWELGPSKIGMTDERKEEETLDGFRIHRASEPTSTPPVSEQ